MRWILLVVALAACPKSVPPPVVIEATSRTVESGADVIGAQGIPATVVGRLERRSPSEGTAEGTAIALADGTAIYVSEGEPPPGWEWMLGTQVRVQGLLWERPEGGWAVPKLLEAEAPMPADVSILLGAPPG